jgi:glycosyltransferase involved in cell wall biosynthesis
MKIALLTPSRDGRAHLDHSEAVAATRIEALRRGRTLKRYTGKGSSNLPRNRNMLAAQALADGCDVLVWVDCDIAFSPDDFFRLVDLDLDVVAALPQARTHAWGEAPRIAGVVAREPGSHGLHEAHSLPTAFMATKADVYRRLAHEGKATEYRCPASPSLALHNWFFYDLREQDGVMIDDAEDYYFCRKWREIGGECWAVPDIRLRHYEGLVCHSLCLSDVLEAPKCAEE